MNNLFPNISLIVPVYNAEKSLVKCVESILSSEYEDFELILVNDGSNDDSGLICDYYAEKETKIRVFHQENRGVSAARNIGIELAQGKWIAFADSDDMVTPQYLGDLIADVDNDFSGLIFQGVEMNAKGRVNLLSLTSGRYQKKEIAKLFQEGSILSIGFPVSKLFKLSIITKNHIRFDTEIHMCEDLVFMLQYLYYAHEIRALSVYNYRYFLEKNSASYKYFSYESELHGYRQEHEKLQRLSIKYDFEFSSSLKKQIGIPLFRPVLSLYINRYYNFQSRKKLLRKFYEQEHLNVQKYYFPGLLHLKIAKRLFFQSLIMFDIYMRLILRRD